MASTPSNRQSYFPPMSSNPTPQELALHLKNLYTATNDHDTAIDLLNTKVGTATSMASAAGVSTIVTKTIVVTQFPGLGAVNDQTGNTSYTVASMDNGILLYLDDASPVAVSLNSAMTTPYFLFATNGGAGLVTFTPTTGLINGGATATLAEGGLVVIVFDGTNWKMSAVPISPKSMAKVIHEWLDSYDATTGLFTQSQPAFTDISGVATTAQIGTGTPSAGKYVDGGTGAWTTLPPPPTVPTTIAPTAGEYLTGYNSGTGLFSQSTPAGISVTITTAALTVGGTQGSMVFTGGLLTAQTPAT